MALIIVLKDKTFFIGNMRGAKAYKDNSGPSFHYIPVEILKGSNHRFPLSKHVLIQSPSSPVAGVRFRI